MDDVLDATAESAVLGKTAGKDAKADKTTYVKLHGIENSRRIGRELSTAARDALHSLPGDHQFLEQLMDYLAARGK